MAKNRNKKKNSNRGVAPMDTRMNKNKKKNNNIVAPMDTSSQGFVTLPDAPQPMDTTEGQAANLGPSSISRKINKGPQVKRAKNVRKMKSIARAVSIGDKKEEKIVKLKTKKLRIQSAKTLYD